MNIFVDMKRIALVLALLLIVSNLLDCLHNSTWHFLDVYLNCCPCYNIELLNASFSNFYSGDLPGIDIDISNGDDFDFDTDEDLDTGDELEDTDLPMPGVRCPKCLAEGVEQWVVPGKVCPRCYTHC